MIEQLPDALAPFLPYHQFMGYKLQWDATKNKMQKFPLDVRTGWKHDPTDPAGWGSFDEATRCPGADGVAFSFASSDPFWFLDIDNAYGADGWAQLSQQLCGAFDGCAVEVSQSGRGLHIFGTGPVPEHGCRNDGLGLEFYTAGRFAALTGAHAYGSAAHNPGAPVLQWLVDNYFPPGGGGDRMTLDDWTDGPVSDWDGYTDDSELLAAAFRAVSASAVFGDRAAFGDLWTANPDALNRAFPDSDQGRSFNASQADAALALRLMFWTGKDCARTEALMRTSALVREKWDERDDYLPRTILAAMATCTDVHKRARAEPPVTAPEHAYTDAAPANDAGDAEPLTRGRLIEGYRLLAADQLVDYFDGCVYVLDRHQIFTPSGQMLDQGQFKAMYGGYTFTCDPDMRRTVRNAWEAFVENQAVQFPKVSGCMFRPDLPAGQLIQFEGQQLLNNYVPVPTRRTAGDPAPFLAHLAKLLPVQRDRDILLAYMAAVIQHKGVKFQWWPLIQGVEGNGKTLLSRCVAEAVGMRHVHTPKADQISNNFNSWIRDKLFIYVEDVYYPDHKREVIEALKPLITNDWLPLEPKGVDQITAYVVANGMLNSNHRDAVRKTRRDRRFAVFYTAQQTFEDLARDGMDGEYFPALYDWLKNRDGWAIVADYLASYAIPDELNPATRCTRAPVTSSTEEAIAESLGSVEQEIMEAADEGRFGFAGGWISSMALDSLLQNARMGRAIPLNKRRELLRDLGYTPHPGLRDGRVNNTIPQDGGKPRLFIREGHIHRNLTGGGAIVDAYLAAQNAGPGFGAVDAGVNKA